MATGKLADSPKGDPEDEVVRHSTSPETGDQVSRATSNAGL